MSKSLQTGGFKCMDPMKHSSHKYDNDSLRVCILRVDIEHPKKLHELHNEDPLASYKLELKDKCCLIIYYKLLMLIGFLFIMVKNQFLTSLTKKSS